MLPICSAKEEEEQDGLWKVLNLNFGYKLEKYFIIQDKHKGSHEIQQ